MIEKLQNKPKINSRNSSQAPSRDAPYQPQSERVKSSKANGGQKGHQGRTLEWQAVADLTIIHSPQGQCSCGCELSQARLVEVEKRQVLELPKLKLSITEHHCETRVCNCGKEYKGQFPDEAKVKVQYGAGVKGLAIYLMNTQFMSLERTTQSFFELFAAHISQGSLSNWQVSAYTKLADVEGQIATALIQSQVIHADETGIHVNGKTQWWHSVSTKLLTHYSVSKQRGLVAMKTGGILETYTGIVIHDCWSAYFRLICQHGLCHAHLQRELTRVVQTTKQEWASVLKTLLRVMKRRVEADLSGFIKLSIDARLALLVEFRALVQAGLELNPAELRSTTTRGAVKQSYARCLLLRLQKYETDWLRFLFDARVPSDNNQAERDVRMVKRPKPVRCCFGVKKVREKVSGGSRGDGAVWFARVRGYISTLRKHKQNVYQALVKVFTGDLVLPFSLVLNNTS